MKNIDDYNEAIDNITYNIGSMIAPGGVLSAMQVISRRNECNAFDEKLWNFTDSLQDLMSALIRFVSLIFSAFRQEMLIISMLNL